MTTEYKVSVYGRVVYLLKLIIYLPFSIASLGVALDPLPYNEPELLGKVELTLAGSAGLLWGVSFIRQIFRFSPRICISELGIKYSGFYLNTFISWEQISSYSFISVRGGFTFIHLKLKNKKWIFKGLSLDVSGLTPGHKELEKEMWPRFSKYRGI